MPGPDAGQRRWPQGASGILGNGTSFLPSCGTYYEEGSMLVSLSSGLGYNSSQN